MRDLTGQRFGRLVAMERVNIRGRNHWRCVCDCGGEAVVRTSRLTDESACGCLRGRRSVHGHCAKGVSSLTWRSWKSMRDRCTNPQDPSWSDYGGRGIECWIGWRSFVTFVADMGERPSPEHTLDRIDVNGNYEPGNCRWATRSEQNRNRRDTVRYEHEGRSLSIPDWADETGIPASVLRTRLKRLQWPVSRALNQPKAARRCA